MGWINHSRTKSKFSISLDQLFRILYGLLFNVCPSWRMPKYVEIRCWPFVFTPYKAFLKAEKRSEKSLPTSFSVWLILLSDWHYFLRLWVYVYCNQLSTWRHNFFWPYYQAAFLPDQKDQNKNLNMLRMKRAFQVK